MAWCWKNRGMHPKIFELLQLRNLECLWKILKILNSPVPRALVFIKFTSPPQNPLFSQWFCFILPAQIIWINHNWVAKVEKMLPGTKIFLWLAQKGEIHLAHGHIWWHMNDLQFMLFKIFNYQQPSQDISILFSSLLLFYVDFYDIESSLQA